MLQLYSVYDKKSQSFDRPFFVKHVQEALRSIEQAFHLPDNQIPWFVKYPADYALYLVGTFNPGNGGLMPTATMGPEHSIEIAALAPTPRFEKVPGKDGA